MVTAHFKYNQFQAFIYIYLFVYYICGMKYTAWKYLSGQPPLGPLLNPHIEKAKSSKNMMGNTRQDIQKLNKKVWWNHPRFLTVLLRGGIIASNGLYVLGSYQRLWMLESLWWTYVTFAGLQYFTWCGSRENNPFLWSTSEFLVCIGNHWQAKSSIKKSDAWSPSLALARKEMFGLIPDLTSSRHLNFKREESPSENIALLTALVFENGDRWAHLQAILYHCLS